MDLSKRVKTLYGNLREKPDELFGEFQSRVILSASTIHLFSHLEK